MKGRGKVKSEGRREIRSKQLLDGHKETRGYWTLPEEALDRTLLVTHFGRGYGPVVMNDLPTNSNVK